ncbi:MAG: DinB family protein [Gemmataceae bacterium]|nr:DinB family protein [Gemmataceae bacterium]
MDVMARLERELTYTLWANRQTLQSLQAVREPPARALEIMAHIVAAESLWLRRLGQGAPELAVWPALSLDECDRHLRALVGVWKSYAGQLTAEKLAGEIAYTNTKGERWSTPVGDVLTHVILHSGYHRGQIATLLGRAGEPAAASDYIDFVRRGHADRGWPE